MAPLTPLISTAAPAATLPDQWKSSCLAPVWGAAARTGAATTATAAIIAARTVVRFIAFLLHRTVVPGPNPTVPRGRRFGTRQRPSVACRPDPKDAVTHFFRMFTAPESVSTVIRAPPEPVVNESSFPGAHLLAFSAAGPSSFTISPLNVETENSAPKAAGKKRSTTPLTDSTPSVARGESPASNRTPPETDSSRARSYEPPVTKSLPLTVEASSSPEASRMVTGPLTASAWIRPPALVTSIEPFTLWSSTPFAGPAWVMEPLTVSADTDPVTPATEIVAWKPSMLTELPAGTKTSRSLLMPIGLPCTA